MAMARSGPKTATLAVPASNGSASPPAAAAPAPATTPQEATGVVAGAEDTTVSSGIVSRSVALVAVAYVIVYGLSRIYWDTDELEAVAPLQDLGAFALFYVAAQAVERLLEPFSKIGTAKATLVSNLQLAAAAFANADDDDNKLAMGQAAAKAQAALNAERANRTVYLWAMATILGMIACGWLRLYFLHAVGIVAAPRSAEILATGLIIGAGTKPLHDLIARLEKAKNQSTDPAETGGN